MSDVLGIIAGGGKFPILIAREAKKRGIKVVAVAHEGETDQLLESEVDEITWIKLGQFGRLIKALKKGNVKKAVMAGTIRKRRMFEGVMPDLKGLSLMSKILFFHDDGILSAVADELSKEGIEIISSVYYLPELVAPEGCLTKRKPTRQEQEDIRFGWNMAKEIGKLDIGQCVVVKNKTVLAVEAIEGTDETILRGGRLAKKDAVVVKVCKPNQDLRFDLPSVGLNTVRVMKKVNASLLAIEAEKTLIFDKEEMISYANEHGICVISIKNPRR
ncbi:MAG: DUF1009 domain-containing protein [Deltaproteobacteria bacterium]|nr:MAG: DUF1009 domain-containing protein [Deltaproteobacteria bacterium]